jgi:hypothetical protein
LSIIGVGGIGGNPEFWDLNSRKKAHDLVLPQAIQGQDITQLKFDPSSELNVAIGTEKGKVLYYDMRYPVPIYTL